MAGSINSIFSLVDSIKKIIRKILRVLFFLIKPLILHTDFYKQKISDSEAAKVAIFNRQNNLIAKYMREVFNGNFAVHNGPFEGMRYIDSSSWGPLLPKILGSYEEPIQDWIIEVIGVKYEVILDVGSAEGYYAVGFGLRMPNTQIIAYDTDEKARVKIQELIRLNNLNNISIKPECTFEELNLKCKKNTLIFCDIEGFEKMLLNPEKVPNLKYVDLIVESHDFIYPNLTDHLIGRFYKTHTIKIAVDYPFRIGGYMTPNKCSANDLIQIQNENRPAAMKFLYMKSKHAKI
jgi:hypothetical protein